MTTKLPRPPQFLRKENRAQVYVDKDLLDLICQIPSHPRDPKWVRVDRILRAGLSAIASGVDVETSEETASAA